MCRSGEQKATLCIMMVWVSLGIKISLSQLHESDWVGVLKRGRGGVLWFGSRESDVWRKEKKRHPNDFLDWTWAKLVKRLYMASVLKEFLSLVMGCLGSALQILFMDEIGLCFSWSENWIDATSWKLVRGMENIHLGHDDARARLLGNWVKLVEMLYMEWESNLFLSLLMVCLGSGTRTHLNMSSGKSMGLVSLGAKITFTELHERGRRISKY